MKLCVGNQKKEGGNLLKKKQEYIESLNFAMIFKNKIFALNEKKPKYFKLQLCNSSNGKRKDKPRL